MGRMAIIYRKALFMTMVAITLCTSLSAHSENRIITLATVNWEPFFGSNLPNGGFYTEISKSAFEKVGYQLETAFVPWKRALTGAIHGNYDGLLGAYYTEDRTKYFSYTNAVYDDELVFFSRAEDDITFKELKDLSAYKIGVRRASAQSDKLKKEPSLTIEEVNEDLQSLNKLIAKRIDLFVTGKIYLLNLINTNHPELRNRIKIVNPAFQVEKLYNPITKKITDHEKIAADFNRGLELIKKDGTYNKILKKYGL